MDHGRDTLTADRQAAQTNSTTAGLTPRQKQILELLRDGKGNKEIAYELGINIGTVKQHVVALFKKLNVRNRTMAVAQTFGSVTADSPTSTPPTHPDIAAAILDPGDTGKETDTILEKRPCVILSLAVPPPPKDSDNPIDEAALRLAARHLHTALAALAYDHDAVFLARRGNAADVIFGVQRTREFDLLRALRTAQTVAEELAQTVPDAAALLRGGLTAALAVASMRRRGGWSGEAIASAGISVARSLADHAPPGTLNLGVAAQDLMVAHGIGGGPDGLAQISSIASAGAEIALPFDQLHRVRASESAAKTTLRGRLNELSTLFHAWTYTPPDGATQLPPVLIVGEAGMGKSHLCLTFAQRSRQDGATVIIRRCQPSDGSGREPFLACDESGHDHSLQNVLDTLANPADNAISPRQLVVLDDVHWLSPSDQYRLFTAACTYQPGRLVLMAARRLPADIIDGHCSNGDVPVLLRLGRLPPDITESVATDRLRGGPSSDLSSSTAKAAGKGIAGRAMGVPLFAVELARHWQSMPQSASPTNTETTQPLSPLWASTPPLSLLTIVCARLDSQNLDRHMLRAVARTARPVDAAGLALLIGETQATLAPILDRAVKAGVLAWAPTGTLTFTHPLMRAVVDFLGMD
jgi:DNA-binding CsgD family transcriptional regulator